jgi:hypothetical protein
VLDGSILARGIHRLKDDQQSPAILRVEHFLQLLQPRCSLSSNASASSFDFNPPVSSGSTSASRKLALSVTLKASDIVFDLATMTSTTATPTPSTFRPECAREPIP